MPLESLFRLVEVLAERIEKYSAPLRQNEMLTRYVLIDPLLRELGWDTENPDQVQPEYSTGTGRVDYALLSKGIPAIKIEAKKLGTALQEGLVQNINYCIQDGTRYFGVTDGRRWEIYETHRPVPLPEKLVVAFDLTAHPPADVVFKAMALWRQSVETGQLQLPQTSLLSAEAVEPSTAIAAKSPSREMQPLPDSSPSPQIVEVSTNQEPADTRPLSQLTPKRYDKPPIAVIFPDGSERAITYWVDLTYQTVNWLFEKGVLTAERCPIRYANRYLVALSPQHPDGKPFVGDKQVGSLHIETNYSGPDQFRNTRLILSHLDQDPERFSVRFSSD